MSGSPTLRSLFRDYPDLPWDRIADYIRAGRITIHKPKRDKDGNYIYTIRAND